jgi:hypothetical protein
MKKNKKAFQETVKSAWQAIRSKFGIKPKHVVTIIY